MARLSSPIENLQDHYPVLVIGSGYGGAIAASRFARAGQRVAVLERGREWQPGDYPSTEPEVLREMQAHVSDGPDGSDASEGAEPSVRHVGSETGLYEFHLGPDLNVFKGCGLGGTSLVNAGVALRADPRVFDDPRWPEALRRDVGTLVEEGYWRAEAMLKPAPYPDHFPVLPKLFALEKSARFMHTAARRPPINVNFTVDGPNHAGVEQHPCSTCGDCVTGCNYAAKNTLIMNYLPDARAAGAEIYTEVAVRSIERRDDPRGPHGKAWLVHCRLLGLGRERFNAPEITVTADLVVLSAGSLGSTEILLRSRHRGLALSAQVGERLTGNGDMLGFAYDGADEVNGVGWGHHRPGEIPPVGPCITGMIDLRNQAALDDGLVIEEGSPPGALARFLPEGLAAFSEFGVRPAPARSAPSLSDANRAGAGNGPGGSGSGALTSTADSPLPGERVSRLVGTGEGVLEAEGRRQKAASTKHQPSPRGQGIPRGPGEGIALTPQDDSPNPEPRAPNPESVPLPPDPRPLNPDPWCLTPDPYRGAVRNTQTFLVMGHDDGAGRMTLESDRLSIHWPAAGQQPVFQHIRERLAEASRALEGVLVMNPLWTKLLHHNLLTVHPLGGCVMAEDAEHGVVNHKGQVFSGESGTAVYESLYVCDGAVIPRPLGVNPLLTISALAERCCALAGLDRGWGSGVKGQGTGDGAGGGAGIASLAMSAMEDVPATASPGAGAPPSPPGRGLSSPGFSSKPKSPTPPVEDAEAAPEDLEFEAASRRQEGESVRPGPPNAELAPDPPPLTPGIEFTETMRGYFSCHATDDFWRGARQGKIEGSSFAFTLTIVSEDLDGMLTSAAHPARMIGSATAPALSPRPLTVTAGIFNLLTADPDAVGTRHMLYRMKLTADDGREYHFEGFKVVRTGRVRHLWRDTTTLYITLYEGGDASGEGPPAVIPAPAAIQPVPGSGNRQSPVLGKGILKVSPPDFARQLTTFRVTNARGLAERLEAEARFGRFFSGILYETYGGVLARSTAFDPGAPPRKKRPLRAPAPEVHFFAAGTRGQGSVVGGQGPGFGVRGLGFGEPEGRRQKAESIRRSPSPPGEGGPQGPGEGLAPTPQGGNPNPGPRAQASRQDAGATSVSLRLTRYRGGAKGPLILAHGLGVSSAIFSIDTIPTNLVEYLTAHGYDVWLLDYRASIDLPSAAGEFTADDIATEDYPAAVAAVRELTGAPSVQMVAHCFGSTTFFMAMLAGLEGVRSAVCSQVATHIVAPPLTRLKCGLHVADLLAAAGVERLTAEATSHEDWKARLCDAALRLYPLPPEESCASAVCHRISFLYSRLYQHAQLNVATHNALHEMFGVAGIRAFEHLALMVRRGHVVTADGRDAYLAPGSNLQRLAIPIRFIHGAENDCFLPESTELTYDLLRHANGEKLYSRRVIPGYGHIDCIFGKDAVRDVYPSILGHLEATC